MAGRRADGSTWSRAKKARPRPKRGHQWVSGRQVKVIKDWKTAASPLARMEQESQDAHKGILLYAMMGSKPNQKIIAAACNRKSLHYWKVRNDWAARCRATPVAIRVQEACRLYFEEHYSGDAHDQLLIEILRRHVSVELHVGRYATLPDTVAPTVRDGLTLAGYVVRRSREPGSMLVYSERRPVEEELLGGEFPEPPPLPSLEELAAPPAPPEPPAAPTPAQVQPDPAKEAQAPPAAADPPSGEPPGGGGDSPPDPPREPEGKKPEDEPAELRSVRHGELILDMVIRRGAAFLADQRNTLSIPARDWPAIISARRALARDRAMMEADAGPGGDQSFVVPESYRVRAARASGGDVLAALLVDISDLYTIVSSMARQRDEDGLRREVG